MCGICGFTGSGGRAVLERMNRTMTHRGPDDEGYYQDHQVSLAMRRLAIVDLEHGRQPQSNEDGSIWVVFNGEIYNHVQVRRQLEKAGHRFTTHHSDTETIVHAYEEYGEAWPQGIQANGPFGVAIWDRRRQRLLLYRDRIGKKPLYWARRGKDLVFGSEIKALLAHPDISRDLDFSALYHYFSLKNLSAPATAFRQVRQLLPGQYLVWEKGEVRLDQYWRLEFGDLLDDITPQEAAEELLRLLDDAVYLRMQCDAPFGAYLSGGVDSSSVVTLMCRHNSRPVTTFCLGYSEDAQGQFWGKAQDIDYSRRMSRHLGTDHHEYILSSQQFAQELPQVMAAFDEPFSGTISTYFLSILIHDFVKVALSGDGADELFGSYLNHRLAWPMYHWLRLKAKGRQGWEDLTPDERSLLKPFDTPEQFAFLAKIAHPRQAVWRMRLAVFDEAAKRQLLSPDFLDAAGEVDTGDYFSSLEDAITACDPLNSVLEIDQQELLANQVLPFIDRLSMAHSVEVRSPFLDYRIVEFANRLPGNFKIREGINKYVHKLAVEPLLPDELVRRPKEGFVQPIYTWMDTSLKSWVKSILAPEQVAKSGLLRPEAVKRLLSEHYEAGFPRHAQIWNLLCFQLWHERVL